MINDSELLPTDSNDQAPLSLQVTNPTPTLDGSFIESSTSHDSSVDSSPIGKCFPQIPTHANLQITGISLDSEPLTIVGYNLYYKAIQQVNPPKEKITIQIKH